jgi:hypothetical protein
MAVAVPFLGRSSGVFLLLLLFSFTPALPKMLMPMYPAPVVARRRLHYYRLPPEATGNTLMNFHCPYLKTHVELTGEREAHIQEKHPELLPAYRDYLIQPCPILMRYGMTLDSPTVYCFPTGFLT